MPEQTNPKQPKPKQHFAKLHPIKLGLACGIISAIFILITTIAAAFGFFELTAVLIQDIYGFMGYNIGLKGILLGPIYGFIDGFIITWVFALIYNKLIK